MSAGVDASPGIAYHLRELEIVRTPGHPRRALPPGPFEGTVVLDVGCGIGQQLLAPELAACAERVGVDPDAEAIDYGRARFPELQLVVGRAERLPFDDGRFDLVFSRVALPYTDLRRSLAEIRRVARPGARVWLTLHPWRMERGEWLRVLRSRSARGAVDRCYVAANSLLLAATGRCVARPWSGLPESVQMPGPVSRMLRRLGFEDVRAGLTTHFIVEARVPPR